MSIDWKEDSYDTIFVIVVRLTKIVQYKPIKIIIGIVSLGKIIIDVVIYNDVVT